MYEYVCIVYGIHIILSSRMYSNAIYLCAVYSTMTKEKATFAALLLLHTRSIALFLCLFLFYFNHFAISKNARLKTVRKQWHTHNLSLFCKGRIVKSHKITHTLVVPYNCMCESISHSLTFACSNHQIYVWHKCAFRS